MATFGTFTSGQVLTAADLNAGLPACVLKATNVSVPHNTDVYVSFSSEEYDPLGWHSTSTNNSRVTPNIAGWYLCNGTVNNMNPSGANFRSVCFIRRNRGSTVDDFEIARFDINNYCPDDFTVTGMTYLNGTTDYVEFDLVQFSGSTKTPNARMSIVRIAG
jgi:hypothetical protein